MVFAWGHEPTQCTEHKNRRANVGDVWVACGATPVCPCTTRVAGREQSHEGKHARTLCLRAVPLACSVAFATSRNQN
eukprot:4256268-Prymnesium_polylepis.1